MKRSYVLEWSVVEPTSYANPRFELAADAPLSQRGRPQKRSSLHSEYEYHHDPDPDQNCKRAKMIPEITVDDDISEPSSTPRSTPTKPPSKDEQRLVATETTTPTRTQLPLVSANQTPRRSRLPFYMSIFKLDEAETAKANRDAKHHVQIYKCITPPEKNEHAHRTILRKVDTYAPCRYHCDSFHPKLLAELEERQHDPSFNSLHSVKSSMSNADNPIASSSKPGSKFDFVSYLQSLKCTKATEASFCLIIGLLKQGFPILSPASDWLKRTFALIGVDPSTLLPDRRIIRKKILPAVLGYCLYTVSRDVLSTGVRGISMSADSWAGARGSKYIGLTIHYVDNFHLISKPIGFLPCDAAHTAQQLKAEFGRIVDATLRCDVIVYSSVGDNAANMKKSMRGYVGDGYYFACTCHNLHLVFTSLLHADADSSPAFVRQFVEDLETVKKIIKFSHKAPIERLISRLSLNKKRLRLQSPNLTRWTSWFNALALFAKQSTDIFQLFASDEILKFCEKRYPRAWISETYEKFPSMLKRLNSYLALLEPMNKLTLFFEQTRSPFQISLVPTKILELDKCFREFQYPALGEFMSQALMQRFEFLYSELNPSLIACAVTPNYHDFQFLPSHRRDDLLQEAWGQLSEWMDMLHPEPPNRTSDSVPPSSPDSEADNRNPTSQPAISNQKKLQRLKERLKAKCHLSAVEFWKSSHTAVTDCFNLATMIFSTPTSSAITESLFSIGGYQQSSRRSRMGGDTHQMLTLIHALTPQSSEAIQEFFKDFKGYIKTIVMKERPPQNHTAESLLELVTGTRDQSADDGKDSSDSDDQDLDQDSSEED